MKTPNYQSLSVLLPQLAQEIEQFIGEFSTIITATFHCILTPNTKNVCLERRLDCDIFHSPTSLMTSYVDFIKDDLLPEIQNLTVKYATWWSFKPDSLLKTYLEKHEYAFNTYFLPEDLITAVLEIIDNNSMTLEGNSDLIIPDPALQKCFPAWMILKKNIRIHCMEHIDIAPPVVSIPLQNEHIANDFYVNSPIEILYLDRTSQFWLHPVLNRLINQNKQIAYSWNEMKFMLLDFCTTNTEHFTRVNENLIYINPESELSYLFQFKYFHLDQIEHLLTQTSCFLGRTNTLQKLWRYKKFDVMTENDVNHCCNFIDNIINNNHNLSKTFYFSSVIL
jgi:hypothetical protein